MDTSWYFTFGCGSPLAKYYVYLEAPDELTARAKMVAMFSTHWAACYQGDHGAGVISKWGLHRLDVNLQACSVRLQTNHEALPLDLYQRAFGGPP